MLLRFETREPQMPNVALFDSLCKNYGRGGWNFRVSI